MRAWCSDLATCLLADLFLGTLMFEVFRHFEDTSKIKYTTKSCLHLLMDGSHKVWWPLTQASTALKLNEHSQVSKVKKCQHWTSRIAASAFWPSEAPASLHQKRSIPSAWPPASPWRHPEGHSIEGPKQQGSTASPASRHSSLSTVPAIVCELLDAFGGSRHREEMFQPHPKLVYPVYPSQDTWQNHLVGFVGRNMKTKPDSDTMMSGEPRERS